MNNLQTLMIVGYVLLLTYWFYMDTRTLREKIKFYIFLKGNRCSQIIVISLCIFMLIKYIRPDWMFTIRISSYVLDLMLSVIGFLMYFLGLGLCVWARYKMKASWTPAENRSVQHTNILITSGPFSFTRNPIYLGLLLIYFGFFIAFKSYLVVIAVFILFIFHSDAQEEEKVLEKRFGDKYLKYKQTVRRFI